MLKQNKSVFSSKEHGGTPAIMRKDGENCCSRNSFLWEDNLQLGNRPFYVPPSPVIGCHWSCVRGKRLHGPFPDFPGDFSHCILRLWSSNQYATLGFKKNVPLIRFINVWSAHICDTALLARLDVTRSVSTFSVPDLFMHSAALALRSLLHTYCVNGKPLRINMDYLPAAGKLSVVYLRVCVCVWRFDSFLFH